MSENRLTALLNERKIDQFQYDTYLLFGVYELGIKYLKNISESTWLEEPPPVRGGFAYQEGRRSNWREIKTIVNLVNLKLEGKFDDSEC